MADMSKVSVDNHEWEKSKENIKPLKGGRRIGEVLAALSKDNSHAKEKSEEFEMQLRVLEDEELLEKWFEYISWTEQYYISSNTEVMDLMKRCVKHFIKKMEFRCHEKFVKIWLKISDLTLEANDIFMYMFTQEIGTSLAMYYKSWALYHEITGNNKKADEVYLLGINRNAEPVESLKQSHREFELRMTKAKMEDGGTDEPCSHQGRVPLNPIPSSKTGKVNSKRVKLRDITTSESRSMGNTGGNNRKCSSASVFEILADDTSTKADMSLPEWTLFSEQSNTEKVRTLPFSEGKENAKELEKMGRTKLKTKSRKCVPVAPQNDFFIYRDDSSDIPTVSEDNKTQTISSRKPLNSITSEILDANNTDMLQDLETDIETKCVSVYPKEKIYMGMNEVSLEELKAQNPKYSS